MKQATVTSRSEYIRTSDLSLATYLICRGYVYRLIRAGTNSQPTGIWEFAIADGLEAVVDEFNAGEAQCEPRKFHRVLTTTRRELFGFLGIGAR